NGNLLDFLRRRPYAPRQSLILQVAEGIDFLHRSVGLVHGDLKCENVLVASGETAVLADFGLSTTVDSRGDTTATAIREWNTLCFSAQELLLDEAVDLSQSGKIRSKTTMSDVYAFGMLILQVRTFKRAYPWLHSRRRSRADGHGRN
ncbi:kinase-like protein, partial [Auricularia subglabra TFB-10046 SS5]